jgi:hypothetical protein
MEACHRSPLFLEPSPLLGIATVSVIAVVPRLFRQVLAFAIRAPESVADRNGAVA